MDKLINASQIDTLRNTLNLHAGILGTSNETTLFISQEMDKLIVDKQKEIYENYKRKQA